ncbi:MAG: EAL domain-containing protein [Nitriliruptoraceae bacterium]
MTPQRETLGGHDFRRPTGVWITVLAVLLASSWALVWVAGGTRTAAPHVFYVPIVLAGLPFGPLGGIVTAVAATVLCGPLMPLDVATGESQLLLNWLIRGGLFLAIGTLAGSSTRSLRHSFEAGLSTLLLRELEVAAPAGDEERAAWEPPLRRTLAEGSYEVVFQPILSLHDGRLLAVEALTRFASPPSAPPDVWFARATDLGLGVELELAVIRRALETSSNLSRDVALSFNASPTTLADERLLALLDRYPDRALIAEVTEHAAVDDYQHLAHGIEALRRRGVELAVDDAGAGFASLRHIVRLNPDHIKLDPSLTQDLGDDPIRRSLADSLVLFARRTGTNVIVEGIETAADLATWRELGADAAQGYLLARPGPLPVSGTDPGAAQGPRTHPQRHEVRDLG